MTAYDPLATPGADGRDPTAVMGRRSVAWLLDLIIYLALSGALFAALAEYVEVPAAFDSFDACAQLQLVDADEASGCLHLGDRVYLTSNSDNAIQGLASLGYFAFFIVLQGATGATPGKALAGVRVVNEQGGRPGIGRSLLRTLLWVVDGAPWFAPLVGFIVGLTTTGHRRVGDMAASTYVVRRSARGAPVVLPGSAAPPSTGTAWGAPPPAVTPPPPATSPASFPPIVPPVAPTPEISGVPDDRPAPPPVLADEPPTWTPPTVDDVTEAPEVHEARGAADIAPPEVPADPEWWSGPEAEPTPEPAAGPLTTDPRLEDPTPIDTGIPDWADGPLTDDEWDAPTTPAADIEPTSDASPTAGPAPFTAPGADPVADAPAPPEPAPLPPPQWDAARNTYLQWDPRIQQWLEWDAGAQQWRRIQG